MRFSQRETILGANRACPHGNEKKLERSEQQIREGKFKSNAEVFHSIDKWLKK
jgi:hypothetical protein